MIAAQQNESTPFEAPVESRRAKLGTKTRSKNAQRSTSNAQRRIQILCFQRRISLPFARGRQSAVKEIGGGAVSPDPIAPAEQVVNFVGKNQFLEHDFLGAQFFYQIGGLLERHVAIVVAMNKENRGVPVRDACDW